MSHTKGPWNGIEYNAEDLHFDTVRIKNHDLESVCITNKKNAKLISVAPEMFELLKTIRDEFKSEGLSTADIDRVLNKAKGQ